MVRTNGWVVLLALSLCRAGATLQIGGPSWLPTSLLAEYAQPRLELDEAAAASRDDHAAVASLHGHASAIAQAQRSHVWSVPTLRAINKQLFERLSIRYDPPATRAPNQPVHETVTSGAATCTGLSLVLISALRSLGVPARMTGTPTWGAGEGNHNWVEAFVFDAGVAQWRYVGASEDTEPCKTWFTEKARRVPRGVWAARAPQSEGTALFPLVWRPSSEGAGAIPAVDRTRWYAVPAPVQIGLASKLVEAGRRMEGAGVVVLIHEVGCPDELAALALFGDRGASAAKGRVPTAPERVSEVPIAWEGRAHVTLAADTCYTARAHAMAATAAASLPLLGETRFSTPSASVGTGAQADGDAAVEVLVCGDWDCARLDEESASMS